MIPDEHVRHCYALICAPTLGNRYRFERIVQKRSAAVSAIFAVLGRIIDGGKA